MSDCLFCKIVAKEIPAEIVYEDDQVIAFKDINPVTPVHILLIPKKHISDLTAIESEDKELIGHLHLTAVKVAEKIGIAKDGFRLVNNCKEYGGQVVYHLHFHLLGGKQLGTRPSA
ncbi:histidine triad nucleotide-binding protein [Metallumcola ferriviriculae]|uniref:Histidine triad nucleotide-binding protein n=1 Tax=Metallumcola ferriviriculae TaxID=3039180 RepID=A0AAU0UM09_9FIRM|nr:histidine triad nucleotide-binding protein [Desulfitibacteraceae bacterium MK1]